MKNKTGIYLGSNIDESCYKNILARPNVILIASKTYTEATPTKYKEYLNFFDESLNEVNQDSFNYELIKNIISDFNLPLLWSRSHRKFRRKYQSEISRFEFQLSIIHASINFVIKHKLVKVCFAYEPHNLSTYIFKQTCLQMGIKTFTLKVSPFPSRLFVIDNQKKSIIPNKKQTEFNLDSFINSRKINISEEKTQKKRLFKTPLNRLLFHNFIYHQYLLKNVTTRDQIKKNDFITFFLHYQPEMTTLPDGGVFVDQFEALKLMSKLCEKLNLKLVVREHPATQTYFNWNWRNKSFVDKILNLGSHILIDDFRESSNDILTHSKAVGTITGTVINESLLNGVPVIAFGDHPFKEYKGNSIVQFEGNFNSMLKKINKALFMDKKEIVEEVKAYLAFASQKSFGANFEGIEKDQEIMTLWTNRHKAVIDFIDTGI